jgi:exopolysaccharide biosynthesis polyprenyl glycosylphosphotransferase
LFDVKIAKARLTQLEDVPLLTFETVVAKEGQLFVKRIIDFVVSAVLLVLLAPVFIIVALAIKFNSKGPVLYRQTRVGLNGRKFTLYKFRTMFEGAEEKLTELEKLNEMGGPVFKMKKDPRITRLGRYLRKFSIDEFPQLFNVLVGHMSLVGPRPPIPEEVVQYEPWQRRRLSMRPGLTCIWQVSGRNKIDFDDWMKLDLKYLDNWSLWLDFTIIMKTIPVVFFGIGAS